ncbi:hypothetical protein [Arcanobacterium hippocoleae]|uniref:hypothetical protein n=1 Tax=Arcanobacterium hippocoleae TaxID=149017 RepID=UPI00333FCBB0
MTAEPAKTDAFHCCEFSPGSPTAAGTVVLAETGGFESIDMDQHALCDAHLGSLAVEPQRYRKYALRIREEYAHIPLTHFLAARIRIVQRLLSRKNFISLR